MTIPVSIDGIDIEYEEEGGGESLMVSVTIANPDGTSWIASGHVTPPVTDDQVADLIVKAANGAAAMRGSGVWMAVQRRVNLDGDS